MKSWKKLLRDNFYLILLVGVILSFFYPTILQRKIPIPADTIVGMYHPWRDNIWDNLTSGVPFKNFLITDPVRQQYVWRKLAVEELKKGQLPLWNPYSFSGTPLLANFQAAPFYPLNILFFILPFNIAWTLLIILQPLLGGIFLYLYLRCIKVSKAGSFLGGIVFSFCGFSIAWLEWNTIIHTILWLPLILLAKEKLLKKVTLKWVILLFFAEISSFFAGHLQMLFYTLIISNLYLLLRVIQLSIKSKVKGNIFIIVFKKYLPFLFIGAGVLLITSIQWLPTLQFILSSTRDLDQGSWMKDGWFIPWQNLIQFIAPDFFGNPATGNYWGVWNYGEFIGFIGLAPLILSLYALIFYQDKKVLFFGGLTFLGFFFAFPTNLAKLPFVLSIPLISTSQPTRLMYIIDFSMCILAAIGLDRVIKDKNIKRIMILVISFSAFFILLWIFIMKSSLFKISISTQYLMIAKRNLIFPTIFFILVTVILMLISKIKSNTEKTVEAILILITIIELFRFGWKFTSFSKEEWIFPETNILNTLTNKNDQFRMMAIDRRIIPPNFTAAYNLYDVAGYDPLYLKNYSQLAAAWDRNKPDIGPAAFNRIITPENFESFIADLLGVKYVLSFLPLKSDKLQYVTQEGETYLYINKNVFPRAFLVENVIKAENNQEEIDKLFELKSNLIRMAIMREDINLTPDKLQRTETAEIISYSPNQVIIDVNTSENRLMVFTDVYYPTWRAFVDGMPAKIYKVDFSFRGVLIPSGKHTIEFKDNLL